MSTIDAYQGLAQQINAAHALATKHADTAIEHAREAGRLLLQVKRQLPHGQWLPWLEANLTVSPRQAQRYMQAAQGKPLPARKIAALAAPKNDTVSYLPETGQTAMAILTDQHADVCSEDWIQIEEVAHAPGFFDVLAIIGMTAYYTKRGVRSDHVEAFICDILPGQYTRKGIGALDWQRFDGPRTWSIAGIKKEWRDSDRAEGRQ